MHMPAAARASIAATLQVDPKRIHVISPYVGGGFGSKLRVHAETILAAVAAQRLHRPVKVALTRRQIVDVVGGRPASLQRIRLGADQQGRLLAVAHESVTHTNADEEFADPITVSTRSLYAAPDRLTRHRLVQLDVLDGEDVRAPGEASGLLGLESSMDELAHELEDGFRALLHRAHVDMRRRLSFERGDDDSDRGRHEGHVHADDR